MKITRRSSPPCPTPALWAFPPWRKSSAWICWAITGQMKEWRRSPRSTPKTPAAPTMWAEHSVINLVPSLQAGKQNIIIDDGRQDFFYEVNMALHKALTQKGIAHQFSIRPGQHSWRYWRESLPQHLDFFKTAFDGKPVKCTTSIDDSSPAKKASAKATPQKKVSTPKAAKKDSI